MAAAGQALAAVLAALAASAPVAEQVPPAPHREVLRLGEVDQVVSAVEVAVAVLLLALRALAASTWALATAPRRPSLSTMQACRWRQFPAGEEEAAGQRAAAPLDRLARALG